MTEASFLARFVINRCERLKSVLGGSLHRSHRHGGTAAAGGGAARGRRRFERAAVGSEPGPHPVRRRAVVAVVALADVVAAERQGARGREEDAAQKILWLVHADPKLTAKTHVADLRSRYAYHNLDAVELRAVYASLPTEFENDHDGAKRIWRTEIRRKLADAIDRATTEGGPIGHAAYDVLSKARRAPLKKAQQAPAPAAAKAKSETAVQGAKNGRADPARAPDAAATTTAAAAAQSQSNHLANGAKVPGRTTLPTRQLSSRSLASVDSLDDEDVFAIPWRECYDENYERCYFFNVATGESRWREPDAPYVPYAADPAADATPKRQRNATTATATPAATDDAAATTPKVARRSLSEPPIQQQQQQQGDIPPSPIMNAAAPPPPTEATPRTKLSAFLQNHAGAQQQQQ